MTLLLDVESGATTARIQPPSAIGINADGAILTLLSAPFGSTDSFFTDWKLSSDAAGNSVIHLLGDRTGAALAPNIFTVELDPRDQSSNCEFQVIRGSFRGGAGTDLLDIVQGSGIVAIDSGTINLASGDLVLGAAGAIVLQSVIDFHYPLTPLESGPTAQNAWLQVKTNGTISYIPIWR